MRILGPTFLLFVKFSLPYVYSGSSESCVTVCETHFRENMTLKSRLKYFKLVQKIKDVFPGLKMCTILIILII